MLNNKIKYILALFIILSLSMNAFSATNFTDDSSDVAVQSSSVDEVAADAVDDVADDQAGDNQNNQETNTNSKSTYSTGNGTGQTTFSSNRSGGSGSSFNFSSMNMSSGSSSFNFSGRNSSGGGSSFNFSGMNFSNMSIGDILSMFMGGNNATNDTNDDVATNPTNDVASSDVSNVPRVVTSTSYAPVSSHPVEKHAQHIIQRLRDNKTICKGDALKLDGVNKLYESDFTNGHLLVYVDGKLVFNEITSGDLDTPIFWITDDFLGQHQISVEFTANGNSNTNTYTEDVLII